MRPYLVVLRDGGRWQSHHIIPGWLSRRNMAYEMETAPRDDFVALFQSSGNKVLFAEEEDSSICAVPVPREPAPLRARMDSCISYRSRTLLQPAFGALRFCQGDSGLFSIGTTIGGHITRDSHRRNE
jgi:hypothetical protein